MAATGAGTCQDSVAAIRPADRAISPPYLLATKLEAWNGRGGGDHLRSHDLEDVIALVDGRAEIVDEVGNAPDDLVSFLSREITTLLDQPRFLETVDGTVVGFGRGGAGGRSGDENRVYDIVLPSFRVLADQEMAGRWGNN